MDEWLAILTITLWVIGLPLLLVDTKFAYWLCDTAYGKWLGRIFDRISKSFEGFWAGTVWAILQFWDLMRRNYLRAGKK